jgi:ClpP class serine protease
LIEGCLGLLAESVATTKPLAAHIETMGASAAYWMASQAPRVTASRGAQVGSIDAYTVRIDASWAAEINGVQVHVISSGPYMGAGVPGVPITEAQLKDAQQGIGACAGG